MAKYIHELVDLAEKIQVPLSLTDLVQVVSIEAAKALQVNRVSIRLLDEEGESLMVAARFGKPVHEAHPASFKLGEGLIGWIALHNQPICLSNPMDDERYIQKKGMTTTIGSYLGVPLRVGPKCIGVMNAVSELSGAFDQGSMDLLTVVAAISAPYLEIARLAQLSERDPLTGAFNRRALDSILSHRNRTLDKRFCVGMLDVDFFKKVNDTHGHLAGDDILFGITQIMFRTLRDADKIIRYGGEEFLFLISDANVSIAKAVAERMRRNIEGHVFCVKGERIRVTASIGIAIETDLKNTKQAIAQADEALYKAKEKGRNRVEVYKADANGDS